MENSEQTYHEEVQKMYKRLVALGYAKPTVSDYADGKIHLYFTPEGMRLRRELISIFEVTDNPSAAVCDEKLAAFSALVFSFIPE